MTEASKLLEFLNLVANGSFPASRPIPQAWSGQFREALSSGLIQIGWGGKIGLTDYGRARAQGEGS